MNYNFIWSTPGARAPIVTIASYGITFNGAVAELMDRPQHVMLGFDVKARALGVKVVPEGDAAESGSYTFAERENKNKGGYIRIGNKDFIRYISEKTGIDFISKAVKYFVEWDPIAGILIVDLDNPIDGLENEDKE